MTRFALLTLAALGIAVAAQAQSPVVVELFTSQGCSSCPPADAILGDLAKRPDVLALSLPVDYWDNLGWRDTYAQAAFTKRQYAYAAARGTRRVYTPQAIIAGTRDVVGSNRAEMTRAIADSASSGMTIALARQGQGLAVTMSGAPPAAEIWLVRFQHRGEVSIGRGENGGRKLDYWNVVREMRSLGAMQGAATRLAIDNAPAEPGIGYAIIVQTKGLGPILGAARIEG